MPYYFLLSIKYPVYREKMLLLYHPGYRQPIDSGISSKSVDNMG